VRTWVLRIRAADRPIFDALVDGRKTIETRAGSSGARSYTHVQPGDTLLFLCGPARLRRTVTRVAIYPSVAALAAHEEAGRVLPWLTSAADLAALYQSFPGYLERIARHGLVAMELAPPLEDRT
jgi:ASC-1-like (ASCH) protein